MIKITLKQLQTIPLSELANTVFKAKPSRFKKIAKVLDNRRVTWKAGQKPTEYGCDSSGDYRSYYFEETEDILMLELVRSSNYSRLDKYKRISIK